MPQRIHTDRGSQFTSDLMAEVNEMLLVKHTMTSPYHAMGQRFSTGGTRTTGGTPDVAKWYAKIKK